jgi:hypothetical protein
MQLDVESFNQENSTKGLPALEMGIGINTGSVIVGNIGSASRMKYGVVGDDVNLTGRIEGFTVGGEILVSSATRAAVGDTVQFRGPIEVKAKGKKRALELFAVVAVDGDYDLHVPAEHRPSDELVPCTGTALLRRVEGKEVDEHETAADPVRISDENILVTTNNELTIYDDFKLVLHLAEPKDVELSEIYAKVTGVEHQGGTWLCQLRITSIPTNDRRELKRLISKPLVADQALVSPSSKSSANKPHEISALSKPIGV